ncbi:hypothetical protein BDQ17DRAFT_1365152, partial [Cyathus striatus]
MITYDNSSHVSNVNSGNTTTNNTTGSYNTHNVDDRSTHTTLYGGVREQYAQAQFTYNQRTPKQADHQTNPQSRQPQNSNWGWEDAYMDETMVGYEEEEEEGDSHMGFIEQGRMPALQHHEQGMSPRYNIPRLRKKPYAEQRSRGKDVESSRQTDERAYQVPRGSTAAFPPGQNFQPLEQSRTAQYAQAERQTASAAPSTPESRKYKSNNPFARMSNTSGPVAVL